MPVILDNQIDLSPVATSLTLPVSSGAEVYSFFGGSLTRSLINWANQSAPLSVIGNPAIATSGAAIDSADYFGLPMSVGTDTSETYIFVANTNSTTAPSEPMFVYCSSTGDQTKGVTITLSNQEPGGTVGFLVNGTSTPLQFWIGNNSQPTWTTQAQPIFYCLTIDLNAMQVVFQTLSTSIWASSSTAATQTKTIPAGATRYSPITPGYIGKPYNTSSYPNEGQVHFFAKYSRVLAANEISAVYAQVKGTLALRGVNI